ncbi:MAG: hypothetical protein IKS27_06205 [Oscillospiraceae bacterium]|jgi:hypothetical protein|nr:hypothetical protein [Oscillospiraceae bacterium]MBQ8929203.1 hypothetical protein [Oscillospiraceae bacterium]MBR6430788.1 hypothetical protein [Oscillospiraceae bacterium]
MTVTMIKKIDILRTLQRNYKAARERNDAEMCARLVEAEEVFRKKVVEDCLRIEVNIDELYKLLPDYVLMLSRKDAIAGVALLGSGLPIDCMEMVGKIEYLCGYFVSIPNDELPNRMTLFVAAFSETRGQEYDMDVFLNMLK